MHFINKVIIHIIILLLIIIIIVIIIIIIVIIIKQLMHEIRWYNVYISIKSVRVLANITDIWIKKR